MNLDQSENNHCIKFESTDSNPDYEECTFQIQSVMNEEQLTKIWAAAGIDVAPLLDRDSVKHPDYSSSAEELRNILLKSVEVYTLEEHDLCDPFGDMKRKLEVESYLQHLDLVSTQEKLDQFQARAQISGWKPQ